MPFRVLFHRNNFYRVNINLLRLSVDGSSVRKVELRVGHSEVRAKRVGKRPYWFRIQKGKRVRLWRCWEVENAVHYDWELKC